MREEGGGKGRNERVKWRRREKSPKGFSRIGKSCVWGRGEEGGAENTFLDSGSLRENCSLQLLFSFGTLFSNHSRSTSLPFSGTHRALCQIFAHFHFSFHFVTFSLSFSSLFFILSLNLTCSFRVRKFSLSFQFSHALAFIRFGYFFIFFLYSFLTVVYSPKIAQFLLSLFFYILSQF